jgi:hypothetical protein
MAEQSISGECGSCVFDIVVPKKIILEDVKK